MRIFIWIIVLFAAAIGIALAARYNVGNVVLFYPPYRIDLSLNFFLLLLALLFALLYAVIQTLGATRRIPQRVSRYRQQKRERIANAALRDAMRNWFEGRFGQAEKSATQAAKVSANAGVAALIGARAAGRQQQPARRDQWLAKLQDDKSLETARLMTQIELHNDAHEPQAALAAVQQLEASGVHYAQAQHLALTANQQAGNWPEVLHKVRMLDKHKALPPALSRRMREQAYSDLLADPALDAESLRQLWKNVPPAEKIQSYIALPAAMSFNRCSLPTEAAAVVEHALANEWDARLLRTYRASVAEEGTPTLRHQIEHCERWQKAHPEDAELSLTLGVLCQRQKLWGKAERQLSRALSLARTAAAPEALQREAHLHLAQLHEALDQPEQADRHYRSAARII